MQLTTTDLLDFLRELIAVGAGAYVAYLLGLRSGERSRLRQSRLGRAEVLHGSTQQLTEAVMEGVRLRRGGQPLDRVRDRISGLQLEIIRRLRLVSREHSSWRLVERAAVEDTWRFLDRLRRWNHEQEPEPAEVQAALARMDELTDLILLAEQGDDRAIERLGVEDLAELNRRE